MGDNREKEQSLDLSRSQFAREAEKYVTSKIHSNKEDLDYVVDMLNPSENWITLDLATGTGHLAIAIAEKVKHVVASDITPEMLKQAEIQAIKQKRTNIDFLIIDVHSIPHKDNTFDLVMSRIAPHHFFDIQEAVSEMIRVTKTGGFIFIEDTIAPENMSASNLFNEIEILRDPSHIRDLSLSEWERLFKISKCEILRIEKRQKEWPLKWWCDRMSTPSENIIQIINLLEANYNEFQQEIGILRNDDYSSSENWELKVEKITLKPYNGYIVAKKM